jgi:RNA polymerase sigma-70 factor (ECF subfamily)
MTKDAIEAFEDNRRLMFDIAYRMLGSVADAEDIVQDTFLLWQATDHTKVRSPPAWLTTVVTRQCINHLNCARVRREEYLGPWLPEPLVTSQFPDPRENAKLADSLSMALLILLETLSPTERAVFLLREVFGYKFEEIALIVEKSETNCRQLLSRARQRVSGRRARFKASPQQVERLLQQFARAASAGDVEGLVRVLAQDVTVLTDGGGEAHAARKPIIGALKVAHFVVGTTRKFGLAGRKYSFAHINGHPGFIGYTDERAVQAIAFGIAKGQIKAIYIINNPLKLQHLRTTDAESN